MVVTNRSDSEIVCEPSGFDTVRLHEAYPRVEQVSDYRHAEWATLGDAAHFPVWSPKASTDRIVVAHTFVEVPVGIKDAIGKASSFEKEVDQQPLDLVKTFPDASATTCDIFASELGHLEVKASQVPCIFCSLTSYSCEH